MSISIVRGGGRSPDIKVKKPVSLHALESKCFVGFKVLPTGLRM